MEAAATFRNIGLETEDGGLRTFVQIDREKAGRLGISVQNIDDTLNDAFGQRQISTIYAQTNQYRVILEALPQYQQDPPMLSRLYVPSTSGTQAPLGSIAAIEHSPAPLLLSHPAHVPAASIRLNLPPGPAWCC